MSNENKDQVPPKVAQENPPSTSSGHAGNPVGGLFGALISPIQAGSAVVKGLEARSEALLQTVASDVASGLQGALPAVIPPIGAVVAPSESAGSSKPADELARAADGLQGAVQVITAPAGAVIATAEEVASALKPPVDPSLVIQETVHAVESAVKNPIASASNVVNAATNVVEQQMNIVARIRGIFFGYLCARIAAVFALVATVAGAIVIGYIIFASSVSWGGGLFNKDLVVMESVYSADYILGIPLGVYLALPKQWGITGVWIGLAVILACICLVATIVLVRTNWTNVVTRTDKKGSGTEGQLEGATAVC